MAATISTRLLGRGTSMVPIYWKRSRTMGNWKKLLYHRYITFVQGHVIHLATIWSKPLNIKLFISFAKTWTEHINRTISTFAFTKQFWFKTTCKTILPNKQLILFDWFNYRYIFFIFVSLRLAFQTFHDNFTIFRPNLKTAA